MQESRCVLWESEAGNQRRSRMQESRCVLWESEAGNRLRRPGGSGVTRFPTATIQGINS
jgi:hypothetical protein